MLCSKGTGKDLYEEGFVSTECWVSRKDDGCLGLVCIRLKCHMTSEIEHNTFFEVFDLVAEEGDQSFH